MSHSNSQDSQRAGDIQTAGAAGTSSAPAQDEMYAAAFEFGWQSYLQHGRSTATKPLDFETVEPELEKSWRSQEAAKSKSTPWTTARETARDAWERVQEALLDGSAKPSAR